MNVNSPSSGRAEGVSPETITPARELDSAAAAPGMPSMILSGTHI